MKNSQKNRKMAKKKRVLIETLKIIRSSFLISMGVTSVLLILNAILGGFIGFNYYLILVVGMVCLITPCWILCDSKRIFKDRAYNNNNKVNNIDKQKRSSSIKRKKIS